MTVTADTIAQALVAEARKCGIDPLRVFEADCRFVRMKVARRVPGWARALKVPEVLKAPEVAA